MTFYLPASFRGIPFAVDTTSGHAGQRYAIHTYPQRDTVWAEPMGKDARSGSLTGFFIGPLSPIQRLLFISACEQPGPGIMTHPDLGIINVVIVGGVKWRESRAAGLGVTEFAIDWIQDSQKLYTIAGIEIGSAMQIASVLAVANVASTLIKAATSGQGIVGALTGIIGNVSPFAASAIGLVTDAGTVASAATGLNASVSAITRGQYQLDRYSDGALNQYTNQPLTSYPTVDAAITGAIQTHNQAVAAVTAASTALLAITDPADAPEAIQTLVSSVAAVPQDPATTIRVLTSLADYQTQSSNPVEIATVAMCRQTALIQLCLTVPTVSYSSSDDAYAAMALITGLMDREIEIAADAFQDTIVRSLREMRSLAVQSLVQSGADLAPLVTHTYRQSLPAAVLSQRLYGVGDRSAEIVARNSVRHPAFCPVTVTVLSR